jgi:hypothetical protein
MTVLSPTITTAELIGLDYRYNYTQQELQEDWKRLCTTTVYKQGAQFKPGMKLCQHFCDNFWHIESVSGKSFHEAWHDTVIMDRVRQWGLQSMSQLWLSWVRRAVFMAAGLPNSSFYRPHFARQIVTMTGIPEGRLFDPCMGWGGRMLGTLSAGWQYYSCDPNTDTFQNVQRMLQFTGQGHRAFLWNMPVENLDLNNVGTVDVVLTSPPYFNLEVYTHDSNQSYNKFNQYQTWSDDWLKPLIRRSLGILNPGGISAWNVMNFGKNDLVHDVIDTHDKSGWELFGTVGFQSPLANIRKLKNRDVTYLFRRKGNTSTFELPKAKSKSKKKTLDSELFEVAD